MARPGVQMQWTWEKKLISMSLLGPTQMSNLVLDAENTINFKALLLRTVLTVNVRCTNLQGNTTTAPFLGIGVVRVDPQLPMTSIGPLNTTEADRSWLFRHTYALPWLPDGEAFSGSVISTNQPWCLDWKYHAGRGTNLNKDVAIRWALEFAAFAGTCDVSWTALHLFRGG